MCKRWIIQLTVVSYAIFEKATGTSSGVEERQRFPYEYLQNYGNSWISGPDGHHYQFHLSEQTWNIAREYCLTLASDLVVISSLQQLMWLIAHYPPNNSKRPERTVQIGLVLVDKENSNEKEWKWVDGTPFNDNYLEWEAIRTRNVTSDIPDAVQRGSCAVLSIDNLILKAVPCDKLPEFDYTNRFICQRSEAQHHEHEKKNNPLWEIIAHLMDSKQKGEVEKPTSISTEFHGFKTRSNNTGEELKDAPTSSISNKKASTSDMNNATKFVEDQKLATGNVDQNMEEIGQDDFDKQKKENYGKLEDKAVSEKMPKENFSIVSELSMGKSVQENETEKNEDMLLAEAIERDFNRNPIKSNDTPNPTSSVQLKQNVQQSGEFCDENIATQKHSQIKDKELDDFFQNFNSFLKHAKSSDLRALIDDNNTDKTLVERLKEAVDAQNNIQLREMYEAENKKILRNEVDEEQQQQRANDSIDEEHDIGDALVHEIDDAFNSDILHTEDTAVRLQKADGISDKLNRLHDTLQSAESSGKEESAEQYRGEKKLAQNALYEQIKEKLESKLMEHLKNQPNLDTNSTNKSTEISEEITSNISEEYSHRNETTVQYYPGHKRKPDASSAEGHLEDNLNRNAGTPRTLFNDAQQTHKKSVIKLNNKFKNSFKKPHGDKIEPKQNETGENKTDIIMGIGKAVSDMENILESAGEEIKRFFSIPRRRL